MRIINTLLGWGEAKLILVLSTSVLVLVVLALAPKIQSTYCCLNALFGGLN